MWLSRGGCRGQEGGGRLSARESLRQKPWGWGCSPGIKVRLREDFQESGWLWHRLRWARPLQGGGGSGGISFMPAPGYLQGWRLISPRTPGREGKPWGASLVFPVGSLCGNPALQIRSIDLGL